MFWFVLFWLLFCLVRDDFGGAQARSQRCDLACPLFLRGGGGGRKSTRECLLALETVQFARALSVFVPFFLGARPTAGASSKCFYFLLLALEVCLRLCISTYIVSEQRVRKLTTSTTMTDGTSVTIAIAKTVVALLRCVPCLSCCLGCAHFVCQF